MRWRPWPGPRWWFWAKCWGYPPALRHWPGASCASACASWRFATAGLCRSRISRRADGQRSRAKWKGRKRNSAEAIARRRAGRGAAARGPKGDYLAVARLWGVALSPMNAEDRHGLGESGLGGVVVVRLMEGFALFPKFHHAFAVLVRKLGVRKSRVYLGHHRGTTMSQGRARRKGKKDGRGQDD